MKKIQTDIDVTATKAAQSLSFLEKFLELSHPYPWAMLQDTGETTAGIYINSVKRNITRIESVQRNV